jgi:hypothetical protein
VELCLHSPIRLHGMVLTGYIFIAWYLIKHRDSLSISRTYEFRLCPANKVTFHMKIL